MLAFTDSAIGRLTEAITLTDGTELRTLDDARGRQRVVAGTEPHSEA